jgi:hypothetical protein
MSEPRAIIIAASQPADRCRAASPQMTLRTLENS